MSQSVVSRLNIARAESRRAARQHVADLVLLDAVTPLDAAQLEQLDALAKAGGVSNAEIDALEAPSRGEAAATASAVERAKPTGKHFVLNAQEQAAVDQRLAAVRAFVEA